jgi:hypothetical protein
MATQSHITLCTPSCSELSTKQKIDSDQPEAVYNWLDEFENSIANKSIGTPFDYPVTKYEQSKKLINSVGYKTVKCMQKDEKVPRFIQEIRNELRKIHCNRKVELTEDMEIKGSEE